MRLRRWAAVLLLVSACGSQDQLARSCNPAYPEICIWSVDGPVRCHHLTSSSFRAVSDPYDLDTNDDGVACSLGDRRD